jgi:hypothetical protein
MNGAKFIPYIRNLSAKAKSANLGRRNPKVAGRRKPSDVRWEKSTEQELSKA